METGGGQNDVEVGVPCPPHFSGYESPSQPPSLNWSYLGMGIKPQSREANRIATTNRHPESNGTE